MKAANLKIRCSALGQIMTNPRSKGEGLLSETCQKYLSQLYVSYKCGREKETVTKYMTKGLQVEEDSLTVFSRYKGKIYFKNQERLNNDFIQGTPDIVVNSLVIDIKSSWDIFTFFATKRDKLNQSYFYQLQGYMALTGAEGAELAYCLVNTPPGLIQDEKTKLLYKIGSGKATSENYLEACDRIDKLMTFDDIPLRERVNIISIERDENAIRGVYERVEQCREYWAKTYEEETP